MKSVINRISKLEAQFPPPRDYLRHPRKHVRYIFSLMGQNLNLETSTSARTLCPNGTLLECVILNGSLDDISEEALKEFIERSPVEIL
jgi:hypothetical protein